MTAKMFEIFDEARETETDIRFEKYRKNKFSDCKVKHILYGIAGGFYFSAVFSSRIRRPWYGIVAGVFGLFLLLECFLIKNLLAGNENYADLSSSIALHDCFLGTILCIMVVLISRYFLKELEWGIFQNEDRQEEIKYLKTRPDMKNFTNLILGIYITCNICYFLALSGHIVLGFYFVTDIDQLKDPEWQFMPHPCKSYVNTEVNFILSSTLLFIPVCILMNLGLSDGLFLIALAEEYYWSMALLWERIEQISKESVTSFENLHEKLVRTDENGYMQVSDYIQQREAECERLVKNLKSAIKVYQRQAKKIQSIMTFLKIKFMFAIIAIILTMFTTITSVYSDSFPLIQKYKMVLMLICITFVWFCYCYSGKIFKHMGDTMIEKVYDLPWYYLHPAGRQDLYIFLNETQKPIVFQAMGIYEAGMPIFLQILKICYSYFNFLRLNMK